MEEFCRLAVYIIDANIAYLIFSLIKQGFKHHSNYIAELLFLLVGSLWLLHKDINSIWALIVALIGIFIFVILPVILQWEIDSLMAENRYDELLPFAKLKANLAWSYPNSHLEEMSEIASEYSETPSKIVEKLRELLGRGEPYDGMTRLYLGSIHFNNRNFKELIDDLRIPDAPLEKQSFEELLYLVRAYLETTRYDEAVEAQLILEQKIYEDSDNKIERKANATINRFVFYAFMGWKEEYDSFLSSKDESLERLSPELQNFWRGVCYFYSGAYDEGEKIMKETIQNLPQEGDVWTEFMKKRLFGMLENKDFFNDHILPKLRELYKENHTKIQTIISENTSQNKELVVKNKVTNFVAFLISLISIIWIVAFNVNDSLELVKMGAINSFLVKNGEYFRLISYMFVHLGWLHLFMNLLALRYFGSLIETIAGWPAFLIIFFISGISGGILSTIDGKLLTIGASGGILGLLSATIVLEFFNKKNVNRFSNYNNFSTLLFILGINVFLGFLEKSIDNSAHIGGLLAGLILGLFFYIIGNLKKIKKVIETVLLIILVLTLSFCIFNHIDEYRKTEFYPNNINSYKQCNIASISFHLEIPESWEILPKSVGFQELTAKGLLGEKTNIIVGLNTDDNETFLNEYIREKTSEFESDKDLELTSIKGPLKENFENQTTYSIQWNLIAYNKNAIVLEYLKFEDGFVFVTRFISSTLRVEEYKNVLKQIVSSLKIK